MARCILANLELCSAGDSLHDVAQLLPPCVSPIIIQELCDVISRIQVADHVLPHQHHHQPQEEV